MNRFSTSMLAIVVVAVMTIGTKAQIKNVLLEQHTGAWCGWCPDGTVKMDEILGLYGTQVIGVKIHNGDAMEIPEQSVIGETLGLTGFPTGSADRRSFGGSVFLNRGAWKTACESQLDQRAKAEVDCFHTLDKTARVAKVRVVANIVESMDFPLRFNVFIVEDDVVGTGSGYDQHNYLTGRAGYENNPYYTQPSVVAGYHHMKVVRKMLGGAWGVDAGLPAFVQAGESYTYDFQCKIDARWNIDRVWFVGMLQANADDNKEIINSAVAVKDGSPLNRIVDSGAPAAEVLPAGSDLVNTYTLANLTDQEQMYTVTLSTTARTPADWSAQLAGGTTTLAAFGSQPAVTQMVVPANTTAELSLTLNIGSTLGIGDARVTFALQGRPTITRSRVVTGVSQEITHLLLETGSAYSMRPCLGNTVCADAVTLDPSDYLAFADGLTKVKLVIWNKGPSEALSAEEIGAIRRARNARIFLCGDRVIASLSSDDLSDLGLQWIGWNMEAGTNALVWLSGQQGDVITGSLGGSIEGHLINYYINLVKITDSAHVFPIMHFQNSGLRRMGNSLYLVSAADTIFGIRSTRNNTRTVLLGISPYVIAQETIRQTLVKNTLDWLAQ
jgi:hypothetical protein